SARPASPVNAVATPGNQTATITWTAPNNMGSAITGYVVEQCVYTGGSYDALCEQLKDPTNSQHLQWWNGSSWIEMWRVIGRTTGPSNTTFVVNGLANGPTIPYRFQVYAENAAGRGLPSSSAFVSPGSVPGTVQSLSATPGDGNVLLSWSAPLSSGSFTLGGAHGINGYRVERSADNGASWTLVSILDATYIGGYHMIGLVNGTTYQFRISAFNDIGNGATTVISSTPSATPGSPRNFAATPNGRSVALTWDAPDYTGGSAITGYRLFFCTTTNCSPTTAAMTDISPTARSVDFSPLNPGTSYTFGLVAVNANGAGSYSAQVPVLGAVPPSAVSNLRTSTGTITVTNPDSTTGTATFVSILWSAPLDNGGSATLSYEVEMSSDGGATWTVLTTATTDTEHRWAPNGLAAGTQVQFRVTPTTNAGDGPTNTVVATVPTQALGGPPNRPTAPTLLSATGGDGTVTLTWAPPQATGGLPVTGYKVEYATNSAMSTGLVVDNANTATSPYTITGLTNNTQYWFRVTAISAAGEGTGSVISAAASGVPAAPSAFTYTAPASTGAAASLSFTAPTTTASGGAISTIRGYRLEQSADGSTWTTLAVSIGANATTITVAPPAPGLTLRYRIAAIAQSGDVGDWATVIASTPAAAAASTVVNSLRATVDATNVTLSWSAPTSGTPTSYKVERCLYSGPNTCGTYTVLAATNVGTTYADSVSGLSYGSSYGYRITANPATTTVVLPVHVAFAAPAAPASLTATAGNESATVTWTAPTTSPAPTIGAYRLEMCSVGCSSA
ncbi:MAG: fibronectin type III domain-containing protein, partial [Acidobacteria bacterium]|nr:fibronectin type III domain-containing protein [Acidobacteriota bacterium]